MSSCEHPREIYKKPGQLSTAMRMALSGRGGLKREKRIQMGKIEEVVRALRPDASLGRK